MASNYYCKRLVTLETSITVFALACLAIVLNGCTTYHPEPLPDQSSMARDLDQLTEQFNAQQNNTHRLDVSDGLDLTEVAMLAVLGNPALRATRATLKVTQAESFAAGLLPDPQLSLARDRPQGDSSKVDAKSIGLDADITALLTHPAQASSTRHVLAQTRLALLWQEWQTIQAAQSLAIEFSLQQQQLQLLQDSADLYQNRYQRSLRGLSEGNVSLDVNGGDLTALLDVSSQIADLQQQHNQTRHALCLALGLQPSATFTIAPLPEPVAIDQTAIANRVQQLAEIRPDLLALQAGYQAQEDRVRAAVMAQFPALSIGINKANDNDNLRTSGLSITITLPIFDRNRGAIALQRATREQLHAEYETRLAQTNSEVSELLAQRAIVDDERRKLENYLPTLRSLVDRARDAYARGDIEALTFLNLESTWLSKRLEQINLLKTSWQCALALQALLVMPGPLSPVTLVPAENVTP